MCSPCRLYFLRAALRILAASPCDSPAMCVRLYVLNLLTLLAQLASPPWRFLLKVLRCLLRLVLRPIVCLLRDGDEDLHEEHTRMLADHEGPAGPAGPPGPRPWACNSQSPCKCCYYNMSMMDPAGNFTTGWRIMFGRRRVKWAWWHGSAPHCAAQILREQTMRRRLLRVLEPAEPACPCCYYTYSAGMPPGCGWFVGHWAPDCGSHTWTWLHHQAPHWTGVYVVPACQIQHTGARYLFPELEGPAGAASVPWDDYRDRLYQAWGWDGSLSGDEDEEDLNPDVPAAWTARGWWEWPAHEGAPAPADGEPARHEEPAGGETQPAAPSNLEPIPEGTQVHAPNLQQEYAQSSQEPAVPADVPATEVDPI